MGYHKQRQIEEDDQGWHSSDKDICYRCITEPYLRELARNEPTKYGCSFCGRSSRKGPNSVPFNKIMKVIAVAVWQYYDQAGNCLGYDSREGGYQGSTYDSYDIVHDDLPTLSQNEQVVQEVTDCLGDQTWCDRRPYEITGVERYTMSWEGFCKTVKHHVRYFFSADDEKKDKYSDIIPVPEMLDELRDIIDSAGLITALPTGTQFFRIRVHRPDEVCLTWQSLGSPPAEHAPSNRMSAAGISVFYAAFDMATARAETTVNFTPTDSLVLTGATWTNTRPLHVLDLTALPRIPSMFAQVRYERDHVIFLREFVESITEPVQHDGRVHIDYVPSQIVTEYFRHRYRIDKKTALDGIIYPSAQRKGGKSSVIFAAPTDLNPQPHDWIVEQPPPILTLCPDTIRRIRRSAARG